MATRNIPEDNSQPAQKKPMPFTRQIPEVKNGALMRRVKGRLAQNQPTPHQLHVMHQQHEANVKNNPRKYG